MAAIWLAAQKNIFCQSSLEKKNSKHLFYFSGQIGKKLGTNQAACLEPNFEIMTVNENIMQ